jgi:plastocyanin
MSYLRQMLITTWIFLGINILNGCSSSEEDTSVDNPQKHVVLIKNMKFEPSELTITPGDSVTWINKDIVIHNTVAQSNGSWNSDDLARGDKFTIKINTGANYLCTLHPVMKGRIIVNRK